MSGSIVIDVDPVEIDFDDVCVQLVRDASEGEFLAALSRGMGRFASGAEDEGERAFAVEFAAKLADLSKWFEESHP